ncbi:MAG: ABC transporter permease [Bdellovibrionales bacterium]|nr:ABC transporter permease [Bdellovibrionales bacterium]
MATPAQNIDLNKTPSGSTLLEGTSLWKDAWQRLRKNKAAVVCGFIVLFLIIACAIGPQLLDWIFGYTFEAQDLEYGAKGPTLAPFHPFGTDFFGRDLLTRVLVGGRISLKVGLIAASVAAIVGTIYGAVSGFFGGKIDDGMMRFVDVLYALPYMFLVIILVTIFEKSESLLFVALGLVGWLTTARIVRGQVLSLKEQDFIQAARSIGARSHSIIFRHLIPNTLGPVIVYFTLTVPTMILQEAFLSFLGLGIQPPNPSLGTLMNDGANQMLVYWWTIVFPGIFMSLLLFSLNFLGDGVRDALDPKMRKG